MEEIDLKVYLVKLLYIGFIFSACFIFLCIFLNQNIHFIAIKNEYIHMAQK